MQSANIKETPHHIVAPDGNTIYGRLAGGGHEKLVIHCHGMTHRQQFLLEVMSADYFSAHGYDHYRFSYYEAAPGSRRGNETTLSTLVRDTQAVIDSFRGKYRKIYLTGHSLGGLTLMMLNPEGIAAMSLWDPALDIWHFWQSAPFLTPLPERRAYLLDYGNIFVISEEWVEEIKLWNDAKCRQQAEKIQTPVQLVIPSESLFLASPHTSPEAYGGHFNGPFEVTPLENADHRFSYRGNQTDLFTATRAWFGRF